MSDHSTRTDHFGGRHYAFCRHLHICGWTGPWRRWQWLARRDGRKHTVEAS